MEPETTNKTTDITCTTDKTVNFSHVKAVANEWMLDFSFISLCWHFKEGKLDEFTETLSTFQGIDRGHSLKTDHIQKRMMCTFLTRIMHGKQLDVQFEKDVRVMPLMSAADIWSSLGDTVADESLFENIANLLLVQSVALCLEKGQRPMASSALKWFENKHDVPQNLRVKLSTIVKQGDTYHPFLLDYSFSRLLETVQSYVDAYLEKNPSDYLLQAATKMVQSSPNMESMEDLVTRDEPLSETTNKSTDNSETTKRKLLSPKMTELWKPDSCKKSLVVLKRISKDEVSRLTFQQGLCEKSPNTPKIKNPRKPPKAATKMVQSSPNMESMEDLETQDEPLSETTNKSTDDSETNNESTTCLRTKRKLLSTKTTELWEPDSCKKSLVVLKRISKGDVSRLTFQQGLCEKLPNTPKIKNPRKPPKKWTSRLDKNLKDGVKHHGTGKWSLILLDYDFEGRTGTMLKDRWRVLRKAYKVS